MLFNTRMKPTRFPLKTQPWRVVIPAKLSPTGKRQARYFKTQKSAKDFCESAKVDGIRSALKMVSKRDEDRIRTAVEHVLEKLGGDPAKLYRAIEFYVKTHDNIEPATVTEAAEAFQAWREKHGGKSRKGVDKSTLDQNRGHLNKLEKEFGPRQLVDITEVEIRKFFDKLTINRRSLYKTLSVFFKWATQYRYLALNPFANIKPYDEFGVNNEFYPVPVFKRMLRVAAGLEPPGEGEEPTKEFIDMLGWFILSGFLGLRSVEAYRKNGNAEAIRWTDLKFSRKRPSVHIRKEVAKVTPRKTGSDQRWITTLRYLNAAKDWLSLLPKPANPDTFIVPWTKRHVQTLKARFTKRTKIEFLENGFRNSWASYGLAVDGPAGVGQLAREMGNTEAVALRHYIQGLEPGSGKEWFGLRHVEVVEEARKLIPVQRGFGERRR